MKFTFNNKFNHLIDLIVMLNGRKGMSDILSLYVAGIDRAYNTKHIDMAYNSRRISAAVIDFLYSIPHLLFVSRLAVKICLCVEKMHN